MKKFFLPREIDFSSLTSRWTERLLVACCCRVPTDSPASVETSRSEISFPAFPKRKPPPMRNGENVRGDDRDGDDRRRGGDDDNGDCFLLRRRYDDERMSAGDHPRRVGTSVEYWP